MEIPSDIVDSIRNKQCILFLGAAASSARSPEGSPYRHEVTPPAGGELSRRLAERCNYPYEDKTNLQRVALYFEVREGGSRQALVQAIRDEIAAPEFVPSPVHHMLAALPFPIVITTNYDRLFDIALGRANSSDGRPRQPLVRIYDPTRNDPTELVPLDPTEDRPILLKLHGDIDRPETVVVTDEDYIVFIQKMSDLPNEYHPIHPHIRSRMNTWPTLFIGYSLKDYNLRLLFRTLRWKVDPANFPLSFAVDPKPDDLIVAVWQRGVQRMVNFIREDMWDFVPALYRQCIGKEYQP